MGESENHQARIVLALALGRVEQAAALAQRAPIEARTFLDLCRECDVHPRVHSVIVEAKLDWFDESVVGQLAAWREKVQRDNLLLLARTEQALDGLLEAGVVPVALKGLDLLHRAWKFDERTLDDVDLLVRREELSTALAVLEKSGFSLPEEPGRTHYIRSSHHLPLRSPGPVPVDFELHWNLAQERRYSIDPGALFARARPLEVAGRPILRLDHSDLVAHLLLHHFSHYFDRRLKWLADLEWVTRAPDFAWSEVDARLHDWGCTVAAGASVAHLRKLDPQTIPADLARRLSLSVWRRALLAPLRSPHSLEIFRGTRRRRVQLYLAAVLLERPSMLPAWLLHRSSRDRRPGENPLDPDGSTGILAGEGDADGASTPNRRG